MTKKIIEASGVAFQYGESTLPALEKVDFDIRRGELVFITGNSGCGKSTLLNMINGIIPEVIEGDLRGKLRINEKEDLPIHERNLFLGNVFQNPRSQFFTTNTTSELVFEMENYGLSKEEMDRRLNGIVEKFGIKKLLNREIFSISSGERQFLALLTALIMDPEIVIFDEPSANLDYGNAMRLRRRIQALRMDGKTVIVADHRCFYLRGIIDKVLLIEDKSIRQFSSESEFFDCDYGKRAYDLFTHEYEPREIVKSETCLAMVDRVSYKDILKDITVDFKKGEVSMIVGVNGVGKTTLAKILSQITKPDAGSLQIDGQVLYIMQDADFQLFGSSCLKELEISESGEEKNIQALKLLNLWEKKDNHPQTLSGGEKQRLQMAISLVSHNDIILLDEPTSGLDNQSMNRVIEMIEILKKDRAVIVISHDYEFIRKSADKIIYIKDSKIADEFYLQESHIEKLNKIYEEMENYYEEFIEN